MLLTVGWRWTVNTTILELQVYIDNYYYSNNTNTNANNNNNDNVNTNTCTSASLVKVN